MGNYNRSTRECSVSQLRPELRQALHNYFIANNLGDLESEIVMCCETVSERKNTGWFASLFGESAEPTVYLAMLLTHQMLLWVRSGDRPSVNVVAANLKDIQVKMVVSFLNRDTGLQITGYIADSKGRISGYLGMGTEPVAQKFCDQVRQAIAEVNPPSTRKWPSWLGG